VSPPVFILLSSWFGSVVLAEVWSASFNCSVALYYASSYSSRTACRWLRSGGFL